MIKFFRKIRQNLLMQNKTSKYFKYALGEIVLVVIGILIALQINNWNENRKNHNLESSFMIRLHDDLQEEITFLESSINYNKQVSDFARKAMSYLNTNISNIKNQEQSLINLYQASQMMDARPSKSTYTELVSSGQINLISDPQLRTDIISYYELDWSNALVFSFKNLYREQLRSKMSYTIQNKIRSKCSDIYLQTKRSLTVSIPTKCNPNITYKEAQLELEKLINDKELKQSLNYLIGNLDSKIQYLANLYNSLNDVKNKVKAYD